MEQIEYQKIQAEIDEIEERTEELKSRKALELSLTLFILLGVIIEILATVIVLMKVLVALGIISSIVK